MAKKFCVMTYGRTGSTALMQALARHDDIAVPSKNVDSEDEELFHPESASRYMKSYARLVGRTITDLTLLVDGFYEANAAATYAGFKSMPHRHPDFSRFVRRSDIFFIALSREDIASVVASFMAAKRDKTWRASSSTAPWEFTEQERDRVARLACYIHFETLLLESMPNAARVTYEDLCDPVFSCPELDEFFQRRIALPAPRGPTLGGSYVENWEEFREFVHQVLEDPGPDLAEQVVVAGAGIEPPSNPDNLSLDAMRLTPDQRMRRRVPLLGANYVEVQLLFAEAAQQAESMASDFANLETFCMFLGHPYGGHELLACWLDAHAEAVVGRELNALRFMHSGFDRRQLYYLLIKNSRLFAEHGRIWGTDAHYVPDQHHGTYRKLRVLGDDKAGGTSLRVGSNAELLELLDSTIDLKTKFVLTVSNPFDNIATIVLEKSRSLERAVQFYFGLCKNNQAVERQVGSDRLLTVHYDDVIGDPASGLVALCEFLDLEADDAYIHACCAAAPRSVQRARHRIKWPASAIRYVDEACQQFEFLSGYSFED